MESSAPLNFILSFRDAWIDDHEVERESQSVGCRPPKDNERDEKLNAAQIKMRYHFAGDFATRTLSMMDFEKIDFDLIEAAIHFIGEDGLPLSITEVRMLLSRTQAWPGRAAKHEQV